LITSSELAAVHSASRLHGRQTTRRQQRDGVMVEDNNTKQVYNVMCQCQHHSDVLLASARRLITA